LLIVLSGRTASGKSTLGKLAAAQLCGEFASFGGYVRTLATSLGLGDDRLTLQDLGQRRVEEDVDRFVAGFLAYAGWAPGKVLVVDGLRHLSVLSALERVVGSNEVLLGHLDISDEERDRRLRARGLSDEDIADIEKHASEIDVIRHLASRAALRLDGSLPLQELSERIANHVAGSLIS
jgi:thymidylate kinase